MHTKFRECSSISSGCIYFLRQSVKWLFSPPSTPWYGGFGERMVRTIKELRKCLGKACVTYKEMLTLLYDCEATMNGPQLTYLSDDPKELKPLTPAHFIQDIKERETLFWI
ncbi:DUF5641 domain-containing protein [Trichonephila clavipes]|nr:DUF5641 domain-containing protein [Trichonephila clavipes]